ncbi:hypothetical protein HK100_012133 [Physocladia obscura]|uniref:Uncharacterized protein n=1 Tax=Physocladia obscura TaxID=109957 RepID=A0AAD5T692_9FUNG|nr:hypothetical protein HK100_012133 [Physocladia obscura]
MEQQRQPRNPQRQQYQQYQQQQQHHAKQQKQHQQQQQHQPHQPPQQRQFPPRQSSASRSRQQTPTNDHSHNNQSHSQSRRQYDDIENQLLPIQQPVQSIQSVTYYARLMALSERYRYPIMAMHYGFIAISCGLVCGMAAQVAITKKTQDGVTYEMDSIMMTAVSAGLSTVAWFVPTLLCAVPALDRAFQRFFDRIRFVQKSRFWVWFLLVNGGSFCLWTVITTLFWDVTWVCWIDLGDGAELNPYESDVCDQLTNIWFYSVFVVGAIFINLYLVVDEQMKLQFANGEDKEEDLIKLNHVYYSDEDNYNDACASDSSFQYNDLQQSNQQNYTKPATNNAKPKSSNNRSHA